MNKKLIELITDEFENLISKKTGWGKNEIMLVFHTAIVNASLRLLDEK